MSALVFLKQTANLNEEGTQTVNELAYRRNVKVK